MLIQYDGFPDQRFWKSMNCNILAILFSGFLPMGIGKRTVLYQPLPQNWEELKINIQNIIENISEKFK